MGRAERVWELLLGGYARLVAALAACASGECAARMASAAVEAWGRAAAELGEELPRELGELPERLAACAEAGGDELASCLVEVEGLVREWMMGVARRALCGEG